MTSPGTLAIEVLGPLVVLRDGRPVTLTAGRLRTLLVMLALSAGEPVTISRLAAALWDVDRPVDAKRSTQVYVTRLRAELGAESIASRSDGYALRLSPKDVDATRFRVLLDAAGRESDRVAQRALLDQALALWRGKPFEDVHSTWLHESEAPRLVERYLSSFERWLDLTYELVSGCGNDLVATLRDLTTRYPMRESLWARLLIALDRCGRQAEALEAYESIRGRIAGQLGTEPGEQLQNAYTVLLTRTEPTHTVWSAVPRQLPADLNGFTGRAAALDALHALVPGAGQTRSQTVVAAICGTAGVGKTTLVVHWAHQVADRFPEGQLFVNLRGFDANGPAMSPTDAIRGFLGALQVPPKRIPTTLDGQAALYRTLLAGRRMLVVLDNARDADQVRPLLPGTASCLAVVTSRNTLPGLAITSGVQPLVLDVLPAAEARRLLATRLGQHRLSADPDATQEILDRCSRLPLALAIVAARAAAHPQLDLANVAAALRDGLEALTVHDGSTDIRSVLSWSYRALSPDAARLFRLLGIHTGPSITTHAAASLCAVSPTRATTLVTELANASLLTEYQPGRYALHDHLRAYARELATANDAADDSRHARHRSIDHYLQTAYAAAKLLDPARDKITVSPSPTGVTAETPTDLDGAMTWYAAEHDVLQAVIADAADGGFHTHTWQLAWTMLDYLVRQGHWHTSAVVQRIAVDAARRIADPTGQAHARRGLGQALADIGQHNEAQTQLRLAHDLFRQLGDDAGQAGVQRDLAWSCGQGGDHRAALDHAQQALSLYQAAGHRIGESNALNAIGWWHAQLGNLDDALDHCERALLILQKLEDRRGQANTWDSIGYVHHHLGQYAQAATSYHHAVDLYRELGNRYFEADALACLGTAYHAAGDLDAARVAWQQAVDILDDLDHPDVERVRASLETT